MNENTRELDQIQTELDRLHERSQTNKATISAHEAVCEERYNQIIDAIASIKDEMSVMHEKVDGVSKLASKGQTSLKTLLWVGGTATAIVTFISMLINIFPR